MPATTVITTVVKETPTPTTRLQPIANQKLNIQNDRKPRTAFPPCETCGINNQSQKKSFFGANAANRLPPGAEDRKDRFKSNDSTQMKVLKLQPKFQTKNSMSSTRSCTGRTGDHHNQTSINPEVVWQLPLQIFPKNTI